MKSIVLNQSRTMNWCCGTLAGLVALLPWAGPATAGQKQAVEAAAYTLSFDPGQQSETPSGKIHIKGISAVVMFVSENPLVTGRVTWQGNFQGAFEGDELNGVASGTGIFEVGTWDLSSDTPVFVPSPTGGLYRTKWEGSGNLLGVTDVKVVGHGIAGEVEGMLFNTDWVGTAIISQVTGWLLDPQAKK